jgi:hypothetical protein
MLKGPLEAHIPDGARKAKILDLMFFGNIVRKKAVHQIFIFWFCTLSFSLPV